MPGMSGLDLARLLTARRRGVPVVMVTARSDLGIDDQAAAIGAICLLRKPFKTKALIDCLEKALKV
jgi:FixJ family two-component response regulator